MNEPTPDQLFKKFLEENGFTFEVYAVSPQTGTLVPVIDFITQPGWQRFAVRMVKKEDANNASPL